ncbi:MAG: TIR domain-containing protein [Bacteroidales bacterium]|nr:TIR domain-containing protein [Bacteroidales bacterium]
MTDYGITKISFNDKGIETISCAEIDSFKRQVGDFQTHDRNWFKQKLRNGKTFCKLIREKNGKYTILDDIIQYDVYRDIISLGGQGATKLPQNITKRKTFLSYYHKDEQYKKYYENLFDDLIVNKSVQKGDINSDNSDEYIKQLIQKEYLYDTTVLVVLLGAKTKHRKHVDWEISGALNYKVGDHYAGLLGIVLPTHPDYKKPINQRFKINYPKRFVENYVSGYAVMIDWTEDRVFMQNAIEKAFRQRANNDKRRNNIPQMQRNTGE